MWIPDRGREGRGQVPATSPAHGAQRSKKGRRRRPGRILPKLYFIGSLSSTRHTTTKRGWANATKHT